MVNTRCEVVVCFLLFSKCECFILRQLYMYIFTSSLIISRQGHYRTDNSRDLYGTSKLQARLFTLFLGQLSQRKVLYVLQDRTVYNLFQIGQKELLCGKKVVQSMYLYSIFIFIFLAPYSSFILHHLLKLKILRLVNFFVLLKKKNS